jgi:predicted phosphodiesterase
VTTTVETSGALDERTDAPFADVVDDGNHRSISRWRRVRRVVAPLFAGAVIAFLVMPFVTTSGRVGPATMALRVRPSLAGHTVVGVPPFGHLTFDSHRGPIEADATVQEINVDAVQKLVTTDDTEHQLQSSAEVDLTRLIRNAAIHLGIVTVVAGAVVGGLIPGRRRRGIALGVAGALLATSGTLAVLWSTYDVDALRHPRYDGALSRAPALVAAIEREFGDLGGVRGRVKVLAGQIAQLSRAATSPLPAVNPAEVRILHVSDIHLNPLGIEIAHNLANTFQVAAVVDTGDLTSFGLPGEANIGSMLDTFPVRYYFVPGNHDSPANRAAVASHPNVTLLDGTAVDIEGVRILGYGDPGFTAYGGISYSDATALRQQAAPEVARLVAAEHPSVLAVAGGALAENSLGAVPLVIYGDIHRRTEQVESGTRVLTVGSTGATGLGSFTRSDDRPYEAEVLRFIDGKLIGLDYVTVHGVSGNFTVDRVVYKDQG